MNFATLPIGTLVATVEDCFSTLSKARRFPTWEAATAHREQGTLLENHEAAIVFFDLEALGAP